MLNNLLTTKYLYSAKGRLWSSNFFRKKGYYPTNPTVFSRCFLRKNTGLFAYINNRNFVKTRGCSI